MMTGFLPRPRTTSPGVKSCDGISESTWFLSSSDCMYVIALPRTVVGNCEMPGGRADKLLSNHLSRALSPGHVDRIAWLIACWPHTPESTLWSLVAVDRKSVYRRIRASSASFL